MVMAAHQTRPMAASDLEALRAVHKEAKENLAAKQTELHLVVASRYKELVSYVGHNSNNPNNNNGNTQGTYGELCSMHTYSKYLLGMLDDASVKKANEGEKSIEQLLKETMLSDRGNNKHRFGESRHSYGGEEKEIEIRGEELEDNMNGGMMIKEYSLARYRHELSGMPRKIHQQLCCHVDVSATSSPLKAAKFLIDAFLLIDALNSHEGKDGVVLFPLARIFTSQYYPRERVRLGEERVGGKFTYQVRMVYSHLACLPKRVVDLSRDILLKEDCAAGEYSGALAALVLMDVDLAHSSNSLANRLLDLYFGRKAKMITKMLNNENEVKEQAEAEMYLTKLVNMVQDLILHTFYIFCCDRSEANLGKLFLQFPCIKYEVKQASVKDRLSRFLTTYLPLIKNKLKDVLKHLSGGAGSLGYTREALYNLTTSIDSAEEWTRACSSMIDSSTLSVLTGGSSTTNLTLWHTLFRTTFDQLVHNLLEFSHESLISKITRVLKKICSTAPNFESLKAQDVNMNALRLVGYFEELLVNLEKESMNLVHQECVEDSSVSLRGSLHIQVCSLMAKFICSMRTIFDRCDSGNLASMQFIVGRICHLMIVKLDPNVKCFHLLDFSHGFGKFSASSIEDLRASFEICNVDDCRYVDVHTITETLEGAFPNDVSIRNDILSAIKSSNISHISFEELCLFSACGLSLNTSEAPSTARNIVSSSLSQLFDRSLEGWTEYSLLPRKEELKKSFLNSLRTNPTNTNSEKQNESDVYIPERVSSYILTFVLGVSGDLLRSLCPADLHSRTTTMTSLLHLSKKILISKSLKAVTEIFEFELLADGEVLNESLQEENKESILIQTWFDLKFVISCYGNQKFEEILPDKSMERLNKMLNRIESAVDPVTLELVISSMPTGVICNDSGVVENLRSSKLYVEALLGNVDLLSSKTKEQGSFSGKDLTMESSDSTILPLLSPKPSTRRFVLLPIQAEVPTLHSSPKSLAAPRYSDDINSAVGKNSGLNPLSKKSFGFLSSMLG